MHTHQKITLDINQNASFVYINAKQGDKNTRYVDAIITCDGVQYKPPVGSMAYFRCEKSDGTGCSYPATINTDGSVTAELTNNALSAPGDVVADISIEGMQGEVLSTASFTIRVEEIPLGDNIESSNEYVRLLALTNRANEIVSELENATFRTFKGYIQATTDGENWVDLVEINTLVGSQGPAGKSAYAYAQDGGYTGTEEEFAEKLAQEADSGATPAFYVTVQMNSDGTAYEANKSLTELDAAHQAGQLLYCIFDDNPDDIHLPLLSKVDGARYTFGGATLTDIITVKISYYEVEVEIRDIQNLDDVKSFYVNVWIDSETGDYVADKTVEEIGEAYRGGRPVFCNYSGSKTSACLVCIGERVANRVYEFSGASFTHTINVVFSINVISVSIKELSTFYVTVSPTDSTATDWKADKTVDEIGEAYQAGRPIFCHFYGETGYRMTLLLTTWTNPPTFMYSFSGADSVRSVTVNITQTGVGVVVKEIPDSGIPIPETAEVGQTIVVKAVDENGKPTAWQAADFPEGGSGGEAFELIASGELTEETTAITITTDNNGNPFKLRRGQFMLQLMGTTTNTTDNGALRIRHNYNTAAKGSNIELITRIRNKAFWTSLFGIYEFFPDIPSSSIYYLPPSTVGGHVGFAEYDPDWNDSPYLSALYLSGITENAKTMGVGTKWELWGVRA